MTTDLAWWGRLAAFLAAQSAVIIAAAILVNYKIHAAQARRAVWQAALLALACIWLGECAGFGEKVRDLWPRGETVILPTTNQFTATTPAPLPADLPVEKPLPVRHSEAARPVTWPGEIWLLGTLLLLLRAAANRAWLSWQRRQMPYADGETQETVTRLRAALRLKSVETRTWARLRGPIAFGWWRPTVALPRGFSDRFSHEQREAMLVHELAHLAARDPFWLVLADTVCALAWWNPLAWWAATQLRAASEAAADEASALVPAGPAALAESLLRFGRELAESGPARGLGVAGNGFRSSLGRRVKKLLTNEGSWRQLPAVWRWSPRVLALAFVVGLTSWPVMSGPAGSVFGLMISVAQATDSPGTPVSGASSALIHKILLQHIGPATISDASIRKSISSKEGERLSQAQLSEDTARLYATGSFYRVTIYDTNTPKGVDVTFVVQQKPIVTDIQFVGNARMSRDALQAALSCKIGQPLDELKLFHDTQSIEALYQKAGDEKTKVTARPPVIDEKTGRASVTIEIRETPSSTIGTPQAMDGGDSPINVSLSSVTDTGSVTNRIVIFQRGKFDASNDHPGILSTPTIMKGPGPVPDIVFVSADTIATRDKPIAASPDKPSPQEASSVAHREIIIGIKFAFLPEGCARQIAFDKLFGQSPPDQTATKNAVAQYLREAKISHPENFRVDYLLTQNETVALSPEQSKATLDSFQQQLGCEILTTPTLTNLPGRQGIVSVGNIQDTVTAVERITSPHGVTNNYLTDPLTTGVTARILPTETADGWNLTVSARSSYFLGYDKPEHPNKNYVLPLPHLRVDEIQGTGTVRTGETLALRGPVVTETRIMKDSVFGIFHRTHTNTVQTRLYLFVTPVSETK